MPASPLVLGIHLCQTSNCKLLELTETTGEYNALNNTGGWAAAPGGPNPQPSEANDAVIVVIQDPSGTSYTFSSPPNWPDPTGTEVLTFSNQPAGIALNPSAASAFSDGIYTVTYTVSGSYAAMPAGFTNIVTQQFLLTCQIRCCIDKMFHLASQSDCTDCKNEKLNNALEAEAFLKSAEYAAACGKIEMAKKHLAKAQWICNTKNCLNC